ncbi:MAG: rhamnulokinase family protein [Clostridia bacterium]
MKAIDLLAFDLGASNGRGILGHFDGSRIITQELCRFDNNYVDQNNILYWDALNLFMHMKLALHEYRRRGGTALMSFGMDTWGVDYGLLDKNGALLSNPRSYRGSLDTDMDEVWKVVSRRELFDRTGIASMNFNTIYQLYRRKMQSDVALEHARTLLLMPDLLGYFFTGEIASEYTNVTTTMLYNPLKHGWDTDLMRMLGLPTDIFTHVQPSGTLRGQLLASICAETGVNAAAFAAVGTHDTASAVAAVPGKGSFAFCSCGTWSLFGMETCAPVITDEVYTANFSNEGTVQGGFCPLNNIMGLWLVQECRREWLMNNSGLSWTDVVSAASAATPFRSIIDPDYSEFFSAGNMQNKIRNYCVRTSQPVPQSIGEVARCIYESLALKYRWALSRLSRISGKPIDTLNIVGGGGKNALLNQMAADSTGLPVIAGPTEAASIGNLLMQAVALGELSGIADVRAVVRASTELITYEPHHTQSWEDAYAKLLTLMEENVS